MAPTPKTPPSSAPLRLAGERLMTFTEAVNHLPVVNGRRHAPSTLYRWCRYGINGARLQYVRVGRNMATSIEAIERFFAALADADDREFAAGREGTP